MSKKNTLGCMGCLATIVAVWFAGLMVVAGAFFWLYLEYQEDPGFWYKRYPGLTRTVSSLILSPLHSAEALEIPEVAFDSDAYDSFVQKQTALVEVFQDQATPEKPFSGSFTDKELMVFVMSELANYGIRHYNLHFHEQGLSLMASIPAQSLRPYLPTSQPEIFYQIYDSLQYINLDLELKIGWAENQFTPFEILRLKPGNIMIPKAVLDHLSAELLKRKPELETKILNELSQRRTKLQSVVLKRGTLEFSGLWNVAQP
jgi:hypothetical protein